MLGTNGLRLSPIYINASAVNAYHLFLAMHGSVYFKLLDDAAYFSVSSVVLDCFVLTKSFQIKFLRPVISGTIQAKGELKSVSANQYSAHARLYNELGEILATGEGSFSRTSRLLVDVEGYER